MSRLANGPLLTFLNADAGAYWHWASEIRSGRWIGTSPFFLAPLYPYWLAVVRTVVGDSIPNVVALQSVLGSLAIVLLADATRRLATPGAAVAVAVALAGYSIAVCFDLFILMESLLFFLENLLLWLVVRDGRASPLWVGTIVGLMALGRPTSMLLLLPYGLHLAGRWRSRVGSRLAVALLVPIVAMAVTAYHHRRVAGAWIPLTYSGGYNFYVGNGPLANGTYVPLPEVFGALPSPGGEVPGGGAEADGRSYLRWRRGLNLSAAQSSAFWFRLAIEHVREQPLRVARLGLFKLGLLVNHRELPQIVDTAAYARAAGPMGWPLDVEFAFFGVLGILGIPAALKRGPAARLVVGFVGVLIIGAAAFFVVDRYRIHLVPPLAILAGIAIAQVATSWRAGDRRRQLSAAGLAAGACAVVFAPLVPVSAAGARWTYATTLGEAWLAKRDPWRAVKPLEEAIALDRAGMLSGSDTPTGRVSRAATYENLGIVYSLLGDDRRALGALAAALDLAPEAASTRLRFADLLASTSAYESAMAQFHAVGYTAQQAAERQVREATQDQARGDTAAMRKHLEAAIGLEPDFEEAVIPLVRLEILTGSLRSAMVRLEAARTQGLNAYLIRAHVAWISALRGDTTGSRHLVESIPADVRAGDAKVAATLNLMAQAAPN
jgi:Tfp pilus assembly protein PilF